MNYDKKKASIIMPTYNAEKYIEKCLISIEKQTFSKNNYELIVLDGGSSDETLEIIKKHSKTISIKLLKNEDVDAESGKYKGIKESRGEIIILLDSDNEIVDKNWLATGLKIMDENQKLWGLESPWIINKNDSLINQYFSLLGISDPLARLLSTPKKPVKILDMCEIYQLNKKDIAVVGANGFFWRKSIILKKLKDIEKIKRFEEVNFVNTLISSGFTSYAKLTKLGVYHYYCSSIFAYFKKRLKVGNKFLARKEKKQLTWIDKVSKAKLFFSILYSVTIIGPLVESLIKLRKDRNMAWIYHSIISFITVSIYGYTYLKKLL